MLALPTTHASENRDLCCSLFLRVSAESVLVFGLTYHMRLSGSKLSTSTLNDLFNMAARDEWAEWRHANLVRPRELWFISFLNISRLCLTMCVCVRNYLSIGFPRFCVPALTCVYVLGCLSVTESLFVFLCVCVCAFS